MTKHDKLYRYLFEEQAVRGELVNVSRTLEAILEKHTYPPVVQALLGELLVATSLLTATLKFEGDITVQLQSEGPVRLVVINGNNRQEMRGLARIDGDIADNASLQEMMPNGYLVITIAPLDGERYQGIVELTGNSLVDCIENYFRQSEQLPTRLFIRTGFNDKQQIAAAGMLLQVLPAENKGEEQFEHLSKLTETIKSEELFNLETKEVLYRLYHQEDVTLFEAQRVTFQCTCSRQRCINALILLGNDELDDILKEDGTVDMQCDFCGNHYLFDLVDIKAIRTGEYNDSLINNKIH